MRLQVLLSTMNIKDHQFMRDMNLQSDAIVINQCNHHSFEKVVYNGNTIKIYSFSEKGIGLSRNNALMRASADVCLFADNDVKYVDDYEKIILDAFHDHPEAGILFFNLDSNNQDRIDV